MDAQEQYHARYIHQLASQASQLSSSASAQLAASDAQHSAEVEFITSQHQSELDSLHHQLTDTTAVLNEQHASDLAFQAEQQKLMVSQLVTFLAWEKDDAMLELSTSHAAQLSSLVTQHDQQLDSVQAKMIEQSMNAMSASSQAAAQALTAETSDLPQDLNQLHSIELQTQQIAFSLSLEEAHAERAQSVQSLESAWEAKVAEAKRSHETALRQALNSAAHDSETESQAQVGMLLTAHASELESLMAEHEQHLTVIATQRTQDQAESLSHLTQAMEQLTHEHAQSLASAELDWTHAQTDQQEQNKQQLLDLTMEHDSSLTDLTDGWQKRLQAAQSQHDAEMSHLSSEHDSAMALIREGAELAQQLHAVQLINLQLEFEQAERKLRADVSAAQHAHATAFALHTNLQHQSQVCCKHAQLFVVITRSNDVVNRHHMAGPMPYFCGFSFASKQNIVIQPASLTLLHQARVHCTWHRRCRSSKVLHL